MHSPKVNHTKLFFFGNLVVIDEFQQITRYPEKNVEEILRTHIQTLSNLICSATDEGCLYRDVA